MGEGTPTHTADFYSILRTPKDFSLKSVCVSLLTFSAPLLPRHGLCFGRNAELFPQSVGTDAKASSELHNSTQIIAAFPVLTRLCSQPTPKKSDTSLSCRSQVSVNQTDYRAQVAAEWESPAALIFSNGGARSRCRGFVKAAAHISSASTWCCHTGPEMEDQFNTRDARVTPEAINGV